MMKILRTLLNVGSVIMLDGDVEVRDHCYITGSTGGSAYGGCNINLKLNHKIPVVFQNLKLYIHILLCKN